MKKRGKQKIDSIEKLAALVAEGFSDVSERFDAVDGELHSVRTELSDIRRRIARLEEQGAGQAGYAKEIDHLLTRVSKIEKHLHLA